MSDASMTAIVEFQIRPENVTMDGWIDIWDRRAQDAWEGEPETSAYAAAVNLEDERNVLVFERYTRGASSIRKHSERPAHAELQRTMGERRVTKRMVMSALFDDIPRLRLVEPAGRIPAQLPRYRQRVFLALRRSNRTIRQPAELPRHRLPGGGGATRIYVYSF